MSPSKILCLLISCGLFLALPSLALDSTASAQDQDIVVRTSKVGEDIVTDVVFSIAATQKEVWSVFVDYDSMPKFLENVSESKITSRSGNKFTVAQSGKVSFGPFFSSYDSMREINLVPMRNIRSHIVGGNIKKSNGLTTISSESGRTKIIYHNETTPNIDVPFGMSKGAIEKQVRKQFQEFRLEILKRAQAAPV